MQNQVSTFSPTRHFFVAQSGLANIIGMAALCTFVFLLLGRFCDFYLSSLHLPMVTSVFALLCALASGRFLHALKSPVSLLMLGFTFWMMLGTPFSLWRGGSVEVLQGWLKSYISFLVITTLVSTISEAIQVLKTVALSISCVAVLAIFHTATYDDRTALTDGLYSGSNELANAAVMGVIAWCFMVMQPKLSPIVRVVYAGGALFAGALLPRTGSRGAMITIGVVFVAALFRLKPVMRILTTLACAAVVVVALLTLPASIRIRYIGMFSQNVIVSSEEEALQLANARGSSRSRMDVLVDSLIVTAKHPIFGVGLGNFGVERNDMMLAAGATRGSYHGTHNTYTQVSSEAGIPGFILFALSIIYCWKDNRRVERLFANGTDLETLRIRNAAFTLRMLLLSFIVFFCFEHIGYDPFYLVVCALITAFAQAAERVHASRRLLADGKAGMIPAKAQVGRSFVPILPTPKPARGSGVRGHMNPSREF